MQTTNITVPTKDVVSQLRHHATTNKTFNNVMHRFALRERARAQVTVQTLRATMESEGFKMKVADCEKVLKILADLKLGTLKMSNKGRILALQGIKLRLQSIGKVALGTQEKLEAMQAKNLYSTLIPKDKHIFESNDTKNYTAVLTVIVNGNAINFPLPPIMGGDLGFLLLDLYSGGTSQSTKGRA